jgi:hypothetical protein
LVNSRLNWVERMQTENPVSTITAQLDHVNLGGQQGAQTNCPSHQLAQPQTASNRQGTRQPGVITEEEKAQLSANTLKYPHHPSMAEGRTAYFEQLHTWKVAYSENATINMHTPFPLRPGTAPVCSGECYTCRMQGHRGADCTAMGTAKIPPQEGRWRALCGRCLGRSRREQPTPVNHVAQMGEFAWAGYGGEEQGNGEGLLV